jgi:ATP-binding cassette subfamily B protein
MAKKKLSCERMLWQHPFYFVFALLSMIFYSGVTLLLAYALDLIIDSATNGDESAFGIALIWSGAAVVGMGLAIYLSFVFEDRLKRLAVEGLRGAMLKKRFESDVDQFLKEPSSNYLSLYTNDVETYRSGYVDPLVRLWENGLLFVAALTYLFFINWLLALVVLVFSVAILFLPVIFGKPIAKKQKEYSTLQAAFLGKLKDLFLFFPLIKTSGSEEEESVRFQKANSDFEKTREDYQNLGGLSYAVDAVFSSLAQIGMMALGAWLVIRGRLTIGLLIAATQLSNSVTNPLSVIVNSLSSISGSKAIRAKLNQELSVAPREKGLSLHAPIESIAFRSVSFAYADKPVLQNFSHVFQKGSKTAIIGPSGAGKSTLLKLALGFYGGYAGNIEINGKPVRDLDSSLYQDIAYVSQETMIFDDTLRYNITLGKDYPEAALKKAIEESCLSEVVSALPLGLDSPVGENGGSLSGGQRQRIGLARALISGKGVLFLDEATSALDPAAAEKIHQNILSSKLTILEVTHQLSPSETSLFQEVIDFSHL